MADNRMFLRCRGCGEEIMLGKLFDTWHLSTSAYEKGEELEKFLKKHGECCHGLEDDTCGGISPFSHDFEPFELTYENRDSYGNEKTLQELDRELHPDYY